MRTVQFQPSKLRALFARQKVATMEELKEALGTAVNLTVLRKLRALGYLGSYSHGGRFYTLAEPVRFDAQGLYRVDDRYFSRFGSLLNTAEHFVVHSAGGYYASELDVALAVRTKEALLTLVRRQRVARTRVDGRYLARLRHGYSANSSCTANRVSSCRARGRRSREWISAQRRRRRWFCSSAP